MSAKNAVLMRLAFGAIMTLSVPAVAFAEKGYLYDNSGTTAKVFDDIPVWVDAASAQTTERHPTTENIRKMKCIAKPRSGAKLFEKTGRAQEVKVILGCRGFVNSTYIHADK